MVDDEQAELSAPARAATHTTTTTRPWRPPPPTSPTRPSATRPTATRPATGAHGHATDPTVLRPPPGSGRLAVSINIDNAFTDAEQRYRSGDDAGAQVAYEHVLGLLDSFNRAGATEQQSRRRRALCHGRLATIALNRGQVPEAARRLGEAVSSRLEAIQIGPPEPDDTRFLVAALLQLGGTLELLGEHDPARDAYEVAVRRARADDEQASTEATCETLALALDRFAHFLAGRDLVSSLNLRECEVTIRCTLITDFEPTPARMAALAGSLEAAAILCGRVGLDRDRDLAHQALVLRHQVATVEPSPATLVALSAAHSILGRILLLEGNPKATVHAHHAVRVGEKARSWARRNDEHVVAATTALLEALLLRAEAAAADNPAIAQASLGRAANVAQASWQGEHSTVTAGYVVLVSSRIAELEWHDQRFDRALPLLKRIHELADEAHDLGLAVWPEMTELVDGLDRATKPAELVEHSAPLAQRLRELAIT